MRDSLKESGKLGISVHGHNNRVPFFGNILDAVTQFIPDYIPPSTLSLDRFGTKKSLRNEVKKSGFSRILVKDFVFKNSPENFDEYWRNYIKYVVQPIKEKLNQLEKSQKKELKEMVKEHTKPYTNRNGIIEFPWEVLILTAKY